MIQGPWRALQEQSRRLDHRDELTPSGVSSLQDREVTQRELTVPPLLVEQREQALADRVAARFRPARRLDGDGVGGEGRVVERVDVPAYRRLSVEPQREGLV